MRGFFQHAIMFHNRAGIDQRECANPGIGANHRAGQHRHAIGKLHACADDGRGMNERRQRETRGTEPPCRRLPRGIMANGRMGAADTLPG